MAIDLPGFRWDQDRATALARALRPVLEAVQGTEITVPDQLAALALAAAAVLGRSRLARDPDAAGRAVATLIAGALRSGQLPF